VPIKRFRERNIFKDHYLSCCLKNKLVGVKRSCYGEAKLEAIAVFQAKKKKKKKKMAAGSDASRNGEDAWFWDTWNINRFNMRGCQC
jgi:hypothetical protein